MKYVQTIDAPVSAVVEPVSALSRAEIERLICLAEKVKRREIGQVTIERHTGNGELYIVGWRKAA